MFGVVRILRGRPTRVFAPMSEQPMTRFVLPTGQCAHFGWSISRFNADFAHSQYRMYWQEKRENRYAGLVMFFSSAAASILCYLALYPQLEMISAESNIVVVLMFAPSMLIGFLYGKKIAELAVSPSQVRSPFKRSVIKVFLFFFVIGGVFSSVNFALNGGSVMPQSDILEEGILKWTNEFIKNNGGATFLIISSIALMASATKRMVGMNTGRLNVAVSCIGTFTFFSMLAISFTGSDPNHSSVFLFAFYQAGVIGGALYAMNRLTRNLNMWEDYTNGY